METRMVTERSSTRWNRSGQSGFALVLVVLFLPGFVAVVDGAGHIVGPGAFDHELVPDPALYKAAKAAANRASAHGRYSRPGVLPTVELGFDGIHDPTTVPPDSTSAVGPERFIEFVNSRVGIFDREGTLLTDISTSELTGAAQNDFITDPQILWDPLSRRFYYTIYENRNGGGV